jgi:hypothetical protein
MFMERILLEETELIIVVYRFIAGEQFGKHESIERRWQWTEFTKRKAGGGIKGSRMELIKQPKDTVLFRLKGKVNQQHGQKYSDYGTHIDYRCIPISLDGKLTKAFIGISSSRYDVLQFRAKKELTIIRINTILC